MSATLCKKCLVGIDAESYRELIEKNSAAVREKDRAAAGEIRRRIEICETCDRLSGPTCLACGCYVELRAIRKAARCPYKKW